jgi:NADPH:quinone reductase-like Zn-dependent oxidoreductase
VAAQVSNPGHGRGVGSHALEIAKSYGAHVTGVDSTSKQDLMRSLGADAVIDYRREDSRGGASATTSPEESSSEGLRAWIHGRHGQDAHLTVRSFRSSTISLTNACRAGVSKVL